MLEDFRSAPISAKEKALFAFVEKIVRESWKATAEDVDAVRRAGWTDEAIYDAVTVCALFKFYNTWIDATGVHDMPAGVYGVMGKRMAQVGYSMATPTPKGAQS